MLKIIWKNQSFALNKKALFRASDQVSIVNHIDISQTGSPVFRSR